MLQINDDNSIYATRGDTWEIPLTISAEGWTPDVTAEDKIRFTIYEKGNTEQVYLSKEFALDGTENNQTSVDMLLPFTSEETKIGEAISKPRDYCYEVEIIRNDTEINTIIGHDADGEKIITLLPEAIHTERS